MLRVVDDLGQRFAAVARRVLDLLADAAGIAADPGHRARREVPVGRARYARQLQVLVLMAARAFHADHAAVFAAALHGWIVQAAFALQRRVAARVTVGAARVQHHARGLSEQSTRAFRPLGVDGERIRRAQLARWHRRQLYRRSRRLVLGMPGLTAQDGGRRTAEQQRSEQHQLRLQR